MPDARWIGRVPSRLANSWVSPWYLGLQRNKILLPYPRPKRSMSQPSCCAQLVWMQQTLKDYDYTMNQVPLLCDNKSTIKITYNPCEYSRTKHIDIRQDFLRDHEIKGVSLFLMCEPINNLLVSLPSL
jgi:hypothetical protein